MWPKWVSFLALFAFFPVPHKNLTAANRNAFILLALVCAPSNFCVSGTLAASEESSKQRYGPESHRGRNILHWFKQKYQMKNDYNVNSEEKSELCLKLYKIDQIFKMGSSITMDALAMILGAKIITDPGIR